MHSSVYYSFWKQRRNKMALIEKQLENAISFVKSRIFFGRFIFACKMEHFIFSFTWNSKSSFRMNRILPMQRQWFSTFIVFRPIIATHYNQND